MAIVFKYACYWERKLNYRYIPLLWLLVYSKINFCRLKFWSNTILKKQMVHVDVPSAKCGCVCWHIILRSANLKVALFVKSMYILLNFYHTIVFMVEKNYCFRNRYSPTPVEMFLFVHSLFCFQGQRHTKPSCCSPCDCSSDAKSWSRWLDCLAGMWLHCLINWVVHSIKWRSIK
jgi:hypothetical protein